MKLQLPTPLVDIIYSNINIDATFASFPEQIKQKLFIKVLELWFFIFNKQSSSTDETSSNYYVQIHNTEISKFRIKYEQTDYGYKLLLNILESANLLDINNKYANNNGTQKNDVVFPKSYRVICKFTTDMSTTEIELDFTKVFQNTNNKQYWLGRFPQYAHLIEDCYKTKIDLNPYVAFLYKNENMKLKPIIKDGRFVERYLDSTRTIDYILRAVKINLQNIWFGTSEQGRFYSSIASLPSIATSFILLDTKKVEGIDIPNCQPLLLSSIISNEAYKKDVQDGSLYEKVGKIIYGEWNKEIKNKVKLQIMVRFFDTLQIKSGDIFEAFNFLYPGFIKQLNELKLNNKIAHLTHKLETIIMVDGLGSLNISKLLKHDEALVYVENVEMVKKYIKNKIKQEFNLEINL